MSAKMPAKKELVASSLTMSAERPAFDFNSIIPEMYRNKAEEFARCLQEKLIFLCGYAAVGQNEAIERNAATGVANCDGESSSGTITDKMTDSTWAENGCAYSDDGWNEKCDTIPCDPSDLSDDATLLVNYDVPYRVLRESSSTSDLKMRCTESGSLLALKRLSALGTTLSERLNEVTGAEATRLDSTRGGAEMTEEEVNATETKSNDPEKILNVPGIKVTSAEDSEADSQVKLRRCSSLKTWKTPPETPGEKKIVRFADALGLDLADVRTFLDEIPKIPSSAYEDLHCDANAFAIRPPTNLTLIPNFPQPSGSIDFMDRVRNEYVCLENAALTDSAVLTVSGCARVRNVGYEKSVHIRYTKDNWRTYSDLKATYVPNSCDGFSDRFSFVLYGHNLNIGEKLEFAIRFTCGEYQLWDNNRGKNYIFECLPQSPSTSLFTETPLNPTDTWSIFY